VKKSLVLRTLLERIVAFEIVNTLWGQELMNTAPTCGMSNCDNPADNAGYGRYHRYCSHHHKRKYRMAGWEYKQHRKTYCENEDGRLGYSCTAKIVEPRWQLEVDHIDGNRENNSIENLQTLCCNCHRVKTMSRQENLRLEKRKNYLEKQL